MELFVITPLFKYATPPPLSPYSLIVILFYLLGFSQIALSETDKELSYAYYEKALTYFDSANFKDAIIQLRNAQQKDNKNISVILTLGRLYMITGQVEPAMKAFEAAQNLGADEEKVMLFEVEALLQEKKYDEIKVRFSLAGKSDRLKALINVYLGRAEMESNHPIAARKLFNLAAKLRPNDAEPKIALASLYMFQGKFNEANTLITEAVKDNPDYASGWKLRGEVAKAQKHFKDAVSNYNKALNIDPLDLNARIGRAAVYLDLNKLTEAFVDIKFITAAQPLNVQVNYLNGVALARQGKEDEAKNAFDQVESSLQAMGNLEVFNDPRALLIAGSLHFKRHQIDTASRELYRYINLDPLHVGARKMLATIMLNTKKPEEALLILKPVESHNKNDPQFLALLGSAYIKTQKYKLAADVIQQALTLSPQSAIIQIQLAMSNLAMGHRKEAIADLEKAEGMDTRSNRATILLAFLYLKEKDFNKTLKIAQKIIGKKPENIDGYSLAAAAYSGLGDFKKVKYYFNKVLSLDKNNYNAHHNLAGLAIKQNNLILAQEHYSTLLKINPKDVKSILGMALLAGKESNIEEHIRLLEKAREIEPHLLRPQLKLINLYLKQNKVLEAIEVGKKMLTIHEKQPALLLSLAIAYNAKKEYKQSQDMLAKVFLLPNVSANYLLEVVRLQKAFGDIEGAHNTLQKLVKEHPDLLSAQAELVLLDTDMGNAKSALGRAKNLRERYPNKTIGYALTGDVYMQMKDYQQALNYFLLAQKIEPGEELVSRIYSAKLFMSENDKGKKVAALNELEKWADSLNNDNTRQLLATGYLQTGQYKKAEKLLLYLLDKQPNNASVLNNLAVLYLKLGDPQALEYAKKAHKQAPKQVFTLDTLGWTMVKQGDSKGGLRFLREAYDRASSEQEIRYHLGVALYQLGRKSEARRHISAVLKAKPKFDGFDDAKKIMQELE